uniref:DUF3192 domain-containing protein n=1 Tax=Desulfobacca acetoxidans TaxID=60893 RepID=A0A7C3Z2G8_9BACT
MSWLVLCLVVVSLACGCGGRILTQWPQKKIFAEYFRLHDVKLGMSQQEVEAIMGPPQIKEEGDFKGGHYVLYFYRTHNMDYEGSNTVRGGYTPFVFQDSRLIGKGTRAYLQAVDRLSWTQELTTPAPPSTQSIQQRRTW